MAENARLLSSVSEERPSEESYAHTESPEKASHHHKLSPPHIRKYSGKIATWTFVLTLLILLPVLTGLAYHIGKKNSWRPLPEPLNLGSCGATPEESRKKGCTFDFMIGAWVRPECMDHAIYQQYILEWKTLNITVYTDSEGLNESTLEWALEGDYEFIWGHGTYHYLHCAYVMERNWKLLLHEVKAVPSNVVEEEHMYHCLGLTGKPTVEDIALPTLRQIFERAPIVDCLVYH